MFSTGDYVLYGSAGVCRIASFEEKSFDGVHTSEYCILDPVFDANSIFYVPSAAVETRVRDLLSREEIVSMIKCIPQIEPLQISDHRNRKSVFDRILKSGDYSQMIPMLKLLYNEKQERLSGARKLAFADQRVMNDAQELMFQEFSVVLGIEKNEVMQYIEDIIRR